MGEELCHEGVDSRGVIIHRHRECLELKVVDEQECLRSDMALTAFVLTHLRADLSLEKDHYVLYEMTEEAIHRGTESCRAELRHLLAKSEASATAEELHHLPLIEGRMEGGSVAELMCRMVKQGSSIKEVAVEMSRRLYDNVPL
ncbi:MAG: hypothetical protein GXX95_11205 [Methanomassiliicoccus sp.]|nr:hypothetical protein [Methanomassiliicoccus sp.]